MANTDRELCSVTDYFGYNTAPNYQNDFNPLLQILNNGPFVQPTQLLVWSENRIDAVQVWYGSTSLPKHGGDGGTQQTPLKLLASNPVKTIQFWASGKTPPRLGQMIITLQDGQSFQYGKDDQTPLGVLTIPDGFQLGGLWGYFGDEVNGLGLFLVPLPR